MMWNLFGSKENDNDTNIAQNLKNTASEIGGQIMNKKPIDGAEVGNFIAEQPNAVYIIDGVKGEPQSIICREKPDGGKTCLTLQFEAVELFKQMQKFEYFCSLPVHDMEAGYFECRKIN